MSLESVKPNVKLHTLVYDLPSEDYHRSVEGYSSSQFKDALEDEEIFVAKHVRKVVEREELAAFDVGTYFHTGVLEPHKINDDCIVYPGKVRRGEQWEAFKKKHSGKAIVTQAQKEQAEGLVRSVQESPVAQEFLEGESEVSLFTTIVIVDGEIVAPHWKKKLTLEGWVPWSGRPKKCFTMTVKVRADKLGKWFISDLKSTTGNAKSNQEMRQKISYYNYDLSAALYLDMFQLVRPSVSDFIWIFASKDYLNSRTYKASPTNIRVGRGKYMRAMLKIAECAAANWKSVDYLDTLEPLPHELGWAQERDIDLL
jgi:hypothetical protein